jgi:hypothetical protein
VEDLESHSVDFQTLDAWLSSQPLDDRGDHRWMKDDGQEHETPAPGVE